jgi:hypothetical protein
MLDPTKHVSKNPQPPQYVRGKLPYKRYVFPKFAIYPLQCAFLMLADLAVCLSLLNHGVGFQIKHRL